MTRKELIRLMPEDAHDEQGAKKVIAAGYPAIAPIMRDLINLMPVAESPAADRIAEYFGTIGSRVAKDIAKGLSKQNCWLRHRILTKTISRWPSDAIRQLIAPLSCIATQPDAYNNDILALSIVREFKLADEQWIKQCVSFKRSAWAQRSTLLKKLEKK